MTYLVFGYTAGRITELLGTTTELPEASEGLELVSREVKFPDHLLRGRSYECDVLFSTSLQEPYPVVAYFASGKRTGGVLEDD